MTAEVYRESTSSDKFGQISRTWSLLKTISCHAHAIEATGRSFGSQETWDKTYDYEDIVKIRTSDEVILTDQIKSIKSDDGAVLWKNADGTDMVFNIVGIAPQTSVFGELVGYDIMVKRAEVQDA